MDPITIAILGGAGLGGLSYFNDKDKNAAREKSNFATRQAIIRNRPLVNYDMPDEYVAPSMIQKLITGATTGLEMGTQLGMAKKLLSSGDSSDASGAASVLADGGTGDTTDLTAFLTSGEPNQSVQQTTPGFSGWLNDQQQAQSMDDLRLKEDVNNFTKNQYTPYQTSPWERMGL